MKVCDGDLIHNISVSENQFGKLFRMDQQLASLTGSSTAGLGVALQNCLTVLETSVERLRWEDLVPSLGPQVHRGRRANTLPPNLGLSRDNINVHKMAEMSNPVNVTWSDSGDSDSQWNNEPLLTRNGHTPSHVRDLDQKPQATTGVASGGMDGTERNTPPTPRRVGLHTHRFLDPPKTILDVDYKLLQSGVAILPGCHDLDGKAVVFIFTSSSLWKNQQVSSADLARLIMYCHAVPRETIRCRGLTIVADIRGCSASTINTLLESLYLFEGNTPQAISIVHLLADKHTQSLVLKSPIYDIHASFQINLLLSQTLLFSYIAFEQLPPVLDGHFLYNHDDWIRFHMRLDPFVASCKAVVRFLISVIEELSAVDQVPATSQEAAHLVDHHENLIRGTFEDPRVHRLQSEGDSMLKSLACEEVNIGHCDDYRYAMEDISRLYRQVQDTINRVMQLSDTRLQRLEKCLQLKSFDEECNKVITWLQLQGNEVLQRHLGIADNLKSVRHQQKEFEKFYYTAMTQVDKGNDLLEEATTMAQSGDLDEVTGYKEMALMLKRHLQDFTHRLEETRERIEGSSKCYHLLDKTYEWALEAMKYVASMRMEHCATPEGIEKLLRSLDMYLREHPPISDSTFSHMTDIAKTLANEKLVEQCQTAQNRCQETQKMLTLRGNTLRQFKDQIEQETTQEFKSPSHVPDRLSSGFKYSQSCGAIQQNNSNISVSTSVTYSANWEPNDTSTPIGAKSCVRAQSETEVVPFTLTPSTCSSPVSSTSLSSPTHSILSVSSSSSSPLHSQHSSSVSSNNASPMHQSVQARSCVQGQNRPLSDGLPDRVPPMITTALPKHLTKTKPSLSKENMARCAADQRQLSIAADSSVSASQLIESSQGASQRPSKKMFKRAVSSPQTVGPPIIEEEIDLENNSSNNRVRGLRQEDRRTDSIITGSSDSIPSLPEEDVLEVTPETRPYVRQEWTPVPVNSHLTEQTCNTPLRPLADLKLSEEERKSQRTLTLVMSEMVQTERDYVCALRYIVENFIPEMEREDLPQALRGKRNVIFGNLEKIYRFHQQYFLQEMEASKRNPFLIAKYFLMHENQFHLYALYNKNKPKSDSLMAEYGKHFFRQKQIELGDKMDLSSYLLKPVQRMGKYALMIKQVLKECPNTAPEYSDLKAAEDMVRFQLRHGNDLLAMDALKECDVNLLEQGRLLRQDEFLVYQGRRKVMRHVFLFEDLILFSKTCRGRNGGQDIYLYKHSFKMSDIGITQDYEGSGYKFEIWWRRRSSGETYVLQAQSSDLKRCWVRDITHLLWNQALKNRESRMTELATMGIGNKPCLDIKPSSDNIQDRFINYAVGKKDARTRNSIAVCSMDHMREGNKRPHSIISVSSNSSSNSSHSGLGLGAMNLAFNPMDSPQTYRRSLTFMSNESGIGTSIASGGDIDCDASCVGSPPSAYLDTSYTPATQYIKHRSMQLPSHSEEVTDV